MLDFIPYYIFYILVWIFLNSSKKSLSPVIIILVLFSAIRYNVGHDYPSYFNAVLDPYNSDWQRFELIPKTLISVAYYLKSPFVFFLLTSIIINTVTMRAIKKFSSSIYISSIAYVCLPFFYIENLCIIRQAIAMAFILYGVCSYIYNKSYRDLIIAIILAYLSHSSSIISILLFFPYYKIGWKYHALLLVGCLLIGTGLQPYLADLDLSLIFGNNSYSTYFKEVEGGDGGKMVLVYGIFAILNLLSMRKLADSPNDVNYKCMSIVNSGFCLLFLLNFNHMLSFRLSRYFIILLIITMPSYRVLLGKGYNYRRIVTICFFILFNLQLIISQLAYDDGRGSKSYVPYQLYFLENTNIPL